MSMIEAKNERFWQCMDRGAKIERMALDVKQPRAALFSRRGYLLIADPGAGRLLACEKDQVTRTEKDGAMTLLAPASGPRDLVYAIDGSVYFTAEGTVFQVTRERAGVGGKAGAGTVRAVAKERGQYVALAPNQSKLYVSDGQGEIRVYDIAADGALGAGRVFVRTACQGLKTDEAGNVWTATKGGVVVFDAQGAELGSVRLPEAANNLNWGSGFRGLYVTGAAGVHHFPTRTNGTRTY
jgi:gluconolactonase